jgi:nucleoid DNA-binding protein
LNRREITQSIARRTGLRLEEVERIVEGILDGVRAALLRNEKVEIRGLGTFETRFRRPKKARVIKTGQEILVPGHYAPHFRPGRALRGMEAARTRGSS